MVKQKETLKKGTSEPEEQNIDNQNVLSDLEVSAQAQSETAEEIRREEEEARLAAEKEAEEQRLRDIDIANQKAAELASQLELEELKNNIELEKKSAMDLLLKQEKEKASVDYIEPSEDQIEVIRTLKSQPEDEFVYINRYGGTYAKAEHIPSDMIPSTKKYKNPFYKK